MENRRINVRAIIWHDGKLLAVKHKHGDSVARCYAVPGGGLAPMESLADGVKRELIEETGIEPVVGRLLFIHQFQSRRNGYDEKLEFFFHIENPTDYLNVDITATTHGKDELALCEFVDPRSVHLLPEFLTQTDIAHYVTNELPPLVVNLLTELSHE
ncbi:NUDIX domain-containing protein [Candidatus Saccharibacteria bacterium]|jgi:ADP-ribose pyrophosphatase YjhB (NUDIX family)|nr:NUDIX domain-containing protein [Candidatus Saccharibacteria bacterium]